MKKLGRILVLGLSLALVAACGGRETHFMKDKAYREAVHADFTARLEQTDAVFSPFDKMGTALNRTAKRCTRILRRGWNRRMPCSPLSTRWGPP